MVWVGVGIGDLRIGVWYLLMVLVGEGSQGRFERVVLAGKWVTRGPGKQGGYPEHRQAGGRPVVLEGWDLDTQSGEGP